MKLRNKKTGEVVVVEGVFEVISPQERIGELIPKRFIAFTSLAALNAKWEDYTPQEPLIRDKNIRTAVRAWAYVNTVVNVIYASRPDKNLYVFTDMNEEDTSIEFIGWIPELIDGEEYTIDELCGGEEDEP